MSFHAVTRYVQRVLRVSVPGDEIVLGALTLAMLHCVAAHTTINAIRAAILTPAVRGALMLGATAITTKEFKAILSPAHRVVVTIEPLGFDPRYEPRRVRIATRRELHRLTQSQARRRQRMPA